MEKVCETFDKLNMKAKNLHEGIIVLQHKSKLMEKLSDLAGENHETKNLSKDIKTALKDHEDTKKEYERVTETTKRIQLKMLYLLEHFNREEGKLQKEARTLKPIMNFPGTPKPLLEREGATEAFSELNTPRMPVSDYAKSPFAKKRTKVQLQFSDFEAEITDEDFAKVPAYMRGRSSQADLQDFLDNVVIRTFNHKYRVLFQHRTSLKPSEFLLQTMFKSQSSYFPEKFITVGDIARILEKNVEKKDERLLQMLRHLQVIREARKNSIVCYIWLR